MGEVGRNQRRGDLWLPLPNPNAKGNGFKREQPWDQEGQAQHPTPLHSLQLQPLPPQLLISQAAQLQKPQPTSASPQTPTALPSGSREQASTPRVATKGSGPLPLPLIGNFLLFSTQTLSAPLIRKPGRIEALSRKWKSPSVGGAPTGASHLNICLELGVGATPPRLPSFCHPWGLCIPKTSHFQAPKTTPTSCSLENNNNDNDKNTYTSCQSHMCIVAC